MTRAPRRQEEAFWMRGGVESRYAWVRLGAAVLISTIGGVGIWSIVVILPTVQTEFAVDRGSATLPYTVSMLCIMVGGLPLGRVADRFGAFPVMIVGALALGAGYALSSMTNTFWQFTLAQGLLIGLLGSAATFAPLVADLSLWFSRRRGIAVSIVASGNYFAGTVWPPVIAWLVDTVGWRHAQFGIGLFCVATMLPLALVLRRRARASGPDLARAAAAAP